VCVCLCILCSIQKLNIAEQMHCGGETCMLVCVYVCVNISFDSKLNIAEHFLCGSETLMPQECLFVCVYVCVVYMCVRVYISFDTH